MSGPQGPQPKIQMGRPSAAIRMPVTSRIVKSCPHCGAPTVYAPDGRTPLSGDEREWKKRPKDGQMMAPTHLDKCPGPRRRR